MKRRLLTITEKQLVDYLFNQERLLQTVNIEFFGALAMLKFCENHFGSKYVAGLEIKERYERELNIQGVITERKFEKFIKEKMNIDSPVDFSICNPDTGVGFAFQMKRFGITPDQKTSQDLINYINNFAKSYGKTGSSLIILCESCIINSIEISKQINTCDYPFEKIILLSFLDGKYIDYTGIWAKTGEKGESRLNLDTMTFESVF